MSGKLKIPAWLGRGIPNKELAAKGFRPWWQRLGRRLKQLLKRG